MFSWYRDRDRGGHELFNSNGIISTLVTQQTMGGSGGESHQATHPIFKGHLQPLFHTPS